MEPFAQRKQQRRPQAEADLERRDRIRRAEEETRDNERDCGKIVAREGVVQRHAEAGIRLTDAVRRLDRRVGCREKPQWLREALRHGVDCR